MHSKAGKNCNELICLLQCYLGSLRLKNVPWKTGYEDQSNPQENFKTYIEKT